METYKKKAEIDFQSLAKQHGYVKARQLLKQETIRYQQNVIEESEKELNNSKQGLRNKSAVRIGSTHGGLDIATNTMLQKILRVNPSVIINEQDQLLIAERVLKTRIPIPRNTKPIPEDSVFTIQPTIPGLAANNSQVEDKLGSQVLPEAIRNALESHDSTLNAANQDMLALPEELGDTLNLQLAFVERITCTRNCLKGMLSHRTPQLSLLHLRYVRHINLSFNQLETVPPEMGVLKVLEKLDLSNNKLSTLPDSLRRCKNLTELNISANRFSLLPEPIGFIDSLTKLHVGENQFTEFPSALVKMRGLQSLNIGFNTLSSLAVQPALLKPEDMWIRAVDSHTGKTIFQNVLTHEKVQKIEFYDGTGINNTPELHRFQPAGGRNYNKRRLFLSICQVHEWEAAVESTSGLSYYFNNVSGDTSWTLPASLDVIGNITSLLELNVRYNTIKTLPQSFTQLVHLRKLVLMKNRLYELPTTLGDLRNLEHLDVTSNELRTLPMSICDCHKLKTLLLVDNQLVRLPDNLGYLKSLRKIDLTANHLRQVPFTLGYCQSLELIIVTENPMVDPPIDQFIQPLETLKWYLRSRFLIETQGRPPPMEFHAIGINSEVTIFKPEFNDIIKQMIIDSKKGGLLNLQLLGIKEIPFEVLKMKKLRRLKLDFNEHLDLSEGLPPSLSTLHSLSLRGCKQGFLPENLSIMEELTALNIEENQYEMLPDSLTELVSLTTLDASKNRLYFLPPGVEQLTNLKSLNLESNRLEDVPPGISSLRALKTLNLSKNRISDLPDSLCDLEELKVLNVECNRLKAVPVRMALLNVVELRIGHNMIERLSDDIFEFNLGKSLMTFSCCENNMMEFPNSLRFLNPQGILDGDYNPLVSPPTHLLAEGLATVQNYQVIRHNRRLVFEELLTDEDFEIANDSLSPVATGVLEEGTGFLRPNDLVEFDQACHEFLNAEFYQCPATAEEIVDAVVKLRDFRETEIYLIVLDTFLKVVKKLFKKDKRFSTAAIFESQRPWGRKKENCNVWVISLLSLLRDTPKNPYQKKGRPSIFKLVKKSLPPIPFPFTVDLLKDSLRLYVSPYGRIADTEQLIFPACDCVDEKRKKPRRHNPCSKAAVVVVKSVYVEKEADRREVEEDEFLMKFEEIEDDIRAWLKTDEGKTLREREIRERKDELKEELTLREEMRLSQQLKLKKCNETLKHLQKRKESFERGEHFEIHGFRDITDAITQLTTQEESLALLVDRLEVLTESIDKIKAQLSQKKEVFIKVVVLDLIQKYCFNEYKATVSDFRRHAAKHDLKRHWDGEDGDTFDAWKKQNRTFDLSEELSSLMGRSTLSATQRKKAKGPEAGEEEGEGENEMEPEYDWRDTRDMSKYKLYLYNRYRNMKDSTGGVFGLDNEEEAGNFA